MFLWFGLGGLWVYLAVFEGGLLGVLEGYSGCNRECLGNLGRALGVLWEKGFVWHVPNQHLRVFRDQIYP